MLAYRPVSKLTLAEYALLPEEYKEECVCAYCGESYIELENVGQLRCQLHPGVRLYDPFRARFYYSCCGTDSSGCCAADHSSEPLSKEAGEREEEVRELAINVVPQLLFWVGLVPPRKEQILMRVDEARELTGGRVKQVSIVPRFKHRAILLRSDELAQEAREVIGDSDSLAELTRLMAPEVEQRRLATRRIDEKWRTNLSLKEAATSGPETFVAFLVVERIALQ